MEAPFDFDSLPAVLAAVLRDVLKWRIARDASMDATAEARLEDLDLSSIEFKEWSAHQAALRATSETFVRSRSHHAIDEETEREIETLAKQHEEADRRDRKARLASQHHLRSVPKE